MAAVTTGWLEGTLVSSTALHQQLVECALGPQEEALGRAVRRCRTVQRHAAVRLGPACGASAVWRVLGEPLASAIGWRPRAVTTRAVGSVPVTVARLEAPRSEPVLLVAAPWGLLPGPLARAVSRLALEADVRWAMVTNGVVWRWLDAQRPLGRRFVGLVLTAAYTDERVWEAFWLLGRPRAGSLEALERLTVYLEAGATRAVRDAVADVRTQLTHRLRADEHEVLTHVFRWLFLLFAEGRGLLPMDNPVYRQAYALSTLAAHAREGWVPFNLWDALQASAALAHTGSSHPMMAVSALNGSLFEPAATPRGPRRHLPDTAVAPMLQSLTTMARHGRRMAVSFADLGVEHLGTIYEDVLAGRQGPSSDRSTPRTSRTAVQLTRKETGTFYTPRDLADHLVARTLGPLVATCGADAVLALRIVDPAAGSGALLASAARFLLAAVEAAWVREGRGGPLDVSPEERDGAMRRIVEHCLYGVDVHGRAVQVARLSLWLESMTRERPLTFLDHHLRVGNSLIGTTPADVVSRRPAPAAGRGGRRGADARQPALFDLAAWDRQAGALAMAMHHMLAPPSDTAEAVRVKARAFRSLHEDEGLRRWRRRADLWCAAWMHDSAIGDGLWNDIDRFAQGQRTTATPARLASVVSSLEAAAQDARCFHWPLEFPDIFHGRETPGFDAVLANPPWEVMRADLGSADDRVQARRRVQQAHRFLARSGFYTRGTTGHRNLYQLFVERMLQVCRRGGRLGIIAPWGLLSEVGSAGSRGVLFTTADVDHVAVFDNRQRIFPIHRSVRFVTLTATVGTPTHTLTLHPPETSVDAVRDGRQVRAIQVEAGLLQVAGGPGLAVPCLRSERERQALDRLVSLGTCLGAPPWAVAFGRELNASDDRGSIDEVPAGRGRLAVVGGRHLRPFQLQIPEGGRSMSEAAARTRLPRRTFARWRVGYRDIASASNRVSLIAALIPPGVVTTHTVFVTQQALPVRRLLYLCGVLNSLVANWYVRLYMGTHVTSALLARLPVPLPETNGAVARRVMRLSGRLRHVHADAGVREEAYVGLQVAVARLYGLAPDLLAAIVSTFPQIPAETRARIMCGYETGSLAADRDPDGHGQDGEHAQ